jgi:5S rRNA maturation endonuclease (ribonuclease M5)
MGITRFTEKPHNVHGFLLTEKDKQGKIISKQVKTYFQRFFRLLPAHNENNMAGSSPCVVCSFTARKRYLNIANLRKQNCATGPFIVTFIYW